MVNVILTYYALEIFIDGILHLRIKKSELQSIQSWTNGNVFSIEYTLASGKEIYTEYDKKEMWVEILESINKLNIW